MSIANGLVKWGLIFDKCCGLKGCQDKVRRTGIF